MRANPGLLKNLTPDFVLVRGNQLLQEAFDELAASGGSDGWYLIVVARDTGELLLTRFGDLLDRVEGEGRSLLRTRCDRVGPPLKAAPAIEIGASQAEVERTAARSADGLLIVVRRVDGGGEGRVAWSILGVMSLFETGVEPPEWHALPPRRPQLPPSVRSPRSLRSFLEEEAPAKERTPHPREESPAGDAAPQARIGGDHVAGNKVIYGDEVRGDKIIYAGAAPQETRDQPRRFEAAFPRECHVGVEQRLWVAVMLPGAPSPFGESGESLARSDEVSIALPVDPRTGELQPIEVEVSITATGCRVEGSSAKSLTVWPDGRTAKRWFQIEPEAAGRQQIGIEVSLGGRLLAEMEVETQVYEPEKKPLNLLDLSLRIAGITLTLSFAAGMSG